MTSVFQLYGRPLAEDVPYPPLSITGNLGTYNVGDAFEGRLQIVNNIGKCRVEIFESSLPPGAYAFVDNFSNEIVLRWPVYTGPEAPTGDVANGGFELGDDGSWFKGPGWSIVEDTDAESGDWCAKFIDFRGLSSIESARVPYNGTVINASCRFQQGASSSGNLTGRILLLWCDEHGTPLPGGEGSAWTAGNEIKSGSNGEYKTSSVTGSNPLAKTVAIGLRANRKKQNRNARVDSFTWDHTYETGANGDIDYTVTFKLTDSANRVAYWTGGVTPYDLRLLSQLYPVVVQDDADSVAPTSGTEGINIYDVQYDPLDTVLPSSAVLDLVLAEAVVYTTYDHEQDPKDHVKTSTITVTALSRVDAVVYSTYNHAQDPKDHAKMNSIVVRALTRAVTAGYVTQAQPQDDKDSVIPSSAVTSFTRT